MAREETAQKEELNGIAISEILKSNNIDKKHIGLIFTELSEVFDFKFEIQSHLPLCYYIADAFYAHFKDRNKFVFILPTGYGNFSSGATYYVGYMNISLLELNRILKLKTFM